MAITFDQVDYAYEANTLWRQTALQDVNLELAEGCLNAIAGASGSGKSTLLQLLNGILKPTGGRLQVLDVELAAGVKPPKLRELRRRVGLVFQFPEHQLFEDTVEKDLCFGPLNFGLSEAEAKDRARQALSRLGLGSELLPRSPFHLSGGQMRKVAIASVLAMDPDVLVLDEPTATLDPVSRHELIQLLSRLCREEGKTVIVVTHRLEEMLPFADRWVMMKEGRCRFQGTSAQLVQEAPQLEAEGFTLPDCIHIWRRLAAAYGLEQEEPCFSAGELAGRIRQLLEEEQGAAAAAQGGQ
ncbi:ABC transporter ATP-binding protein [Paenibacillus sp. CAA11]|uniref:energy-coupling factor transporter ATPase n=1 Tax=Paenibacillus sp. CAA11 TaxID=1532905 RepID=UPI000D3A3BDC|nr:energy-coupling factor transporter ATPase [Paenibacillus sp. CAA11]AWB43239.1 ABC transporter ATP-binding protein [Paenibacillus sp. CAA11]